MSSPPPREPFVCANCKNSRRPKQPDGVYYWVAFEPAPGKFMTLCNLCAEDGLKSSQSVFKLISELFKFNGAPC